MGVFSFLLGKHKAAIEVYNEAARLNQKDWVKVLALLSTTIKHYSETKNLYSVAQSDFSVYFL